jgi:hypothetical protein
MDYHLERGVRLKAEIKDTTLYRWAISELNELGNPLSTDYIPWRWMLCFSATSCVLSHFAAVSELRKPAEKEQSDKAKDAAPNRHYLIRLALVPGLPEEQGNWRATTFSMFGTDRVIKDIELVIYPASEGNGEEQCTAWGAPSYTSDIDFRKVKEPDRLQFSLYVKPDTFAQYVFMASRGEMSGAIFSAGEVDGFYADWSPEISTDKVKVLTDDDNDHRVSVPDGCTIVPPRLKRVGRAQLRVDRRSELFAPPATEPEPTYVPEPPPIEPPSPAPADPRLLIALQSLRTLGTWAVGLLGVIAVLLLFHR